MCTTTTEFIDGIELQVTTYCNTCPEAIERAKRLAAVPEVSYQQQLDVKALMFKVQLRDMAEHIVYTYSVNQVETNTLVVLMETIELWGYELTDKLYQGLLQELRDAACRIPKDMNDTVFNV